MNLKELILYGHKTREIREKYENPNRTSFIPDKEGKVVGVMANLIVKEKGARRQIKADERLKHELHDQGCGCGACKHNAVEEWEEATDETNWNYHQGRWTITDCECDEKKVPSRRKKKRRH